MIKKILLVCITFLCSLDYATSQQLSARIKLNKTNLKKGYNYGAFTANKNYLAWGEFYTGEISIYNLITHNLNNLKLRKGRGPHEFLFYTALTLTEDNRLIIGDSQGIKLIIYNIETGGFNHDIKLNQLRPYRLDAVNKVIFSLNLLFQNNSIYEIFDVNRKKIKSIDMAGLDVSKEFKNPFKRDGDITANENYGVHITRYYPYLYICDLKSHKFLKKVQFDQWNTKNGRTTAINGHKAFTAPTDVDVENKDIAFLPGSMHKLLMLGQGKSKHRNYDLSHLRVYNFKKEQFTKALDLGVKANEIAVNDHYLFAYSKDKNAIFQYKIVSSKQTDQ